MLTGLFDEQVLLKKLDQKTDPLARLNSIVDWQIFLPIIEKALGRQDSASTGRKPYPPLLMFKILILQSLHKLSDEGVEWELLKDLLARRFVGLSGRQFGPDAMKHKFIHKWQVSAANVHDSQVFLEILSENTSRDVYADSAYVSEASRQRLRALGYRAHLQRKGQKKQPLSAWEKQGNRRRSRSRVEHVFGSQLQRADTLLVRCIGLVRARVKIGLRNLAYNMDRLGFLAGTC